MNEPIHFLPEALDDSPWSINEVEAIQSSVDLTNKIANVPKAHTRAQEQIRLHEMGHVGLSDDHQHDIDMATFICRMLEEVRVDAALYKNAGIDVRHRHDDFEWNIAELEKTPFARAMAWLQTAFHVTKPTIAPDVIDFNKTCWTALAPQCQALLRDAFQNVYDHCDDIGVREQEVKELLKFFMPPPPKKPHEPRYTKLDVIQEVSRQITEEYQERQEKRQFEKEKLEKKKPGKPLQEMPGPTLEELKELDKLGESPSHDVQRFGGAEVHDHVARLQKVVQVKAPFTQTGRGLVPEFMENFLVNRRVFRTEHRGGSLVLDCSGSMSPDFPKITAQMHEFPNLAVISYQSATHTRMAGTSIQGRICVHARNGRIDPLFQREPGTNGGNSVDVEALEYGGKFKGPRVWVSDGEAHGGQYDTTGYGWRDYNSSLSIKIREVMRQYHYIRVTNLDDALAWINRSRPVVYYLSGILDHTNPQQKDTRKERRP